MPQGVEDRHHVGALFGRAVERPVGIHGGMPLVGGDLVVEIRGRRGPVPYRDDDVALHALRPRWPRGGQLAGGDLVGPLREQLVGARGVEPADVGHHLHHGLPRLDPACPRFLRRAEVAQLLWNGAGRLVAELMAGVAAVRLHDVEPLGLAPKGGRRAIAVGSGTGELALLRHLEHRVPVNGRVVLRRGGGARGHHGAQVEGSARRALHRCRVDETVTAHPHAVAGLGQIQHEVATLLVGDHDARELGRQVERLRDHPHSRLRSVRARDHSPKIGGPDAHAAGLRSQSGLSGQEERADARHHYHADGEDPRWPHLTAPSVAIDPRALPSLPLGAGYSPGHARGRQSSRPAH